MLSIIIVNHNAKQLTLNCLASIKNITLVPHEIILIDNASTDNIIEEIKIRFPKVRIITSCINQGFACANNQGLKIAEGKYVLLLNNDTILRNSALDKMVEFMESHLDAGALTCKLYDADGKTIQRNCRAFPVTPFDTLFGRASFLTRLFPNNPISQKNTLSDWNYNSARQVDWVSGACMLIRKAVIDQIGYLDEEYFMYWEDTDFCKRASDAGWQIWFVPQAEIIHFSGQGGGKRSLQLKLYTIYQMHHSAYYYFRKHYYHHPLYPMAILTYIGMWVLVITKSLIEIIKTLMDTGSW